MFKSYAEALEWIAEGQAVHGKKAFTSRPEYVSAYPEILKLSKDAGAKRTRKNKIITCSLLAHSLHGVM